MLEKVEVRNYSGGVLTFLLEDPASGFVVRDIQGLDPVKAILASSGFAGVDGAQFQSARRESRNILAIIGLEPDYATQSVKSLRDTLYDVIMPKDRCSVWFFDTDESLVYIDGRVESIETELFVQEPYATISIMCFDPDFVDPEDTIFNEDTVDDETEILVEYSGTVDTGFVFNLFVDRVLTEFTIYQRTPADEIITLSFSGDLEAGDTLQIRTGVGEKRAQLTRGGVLTSVLYGLSTPTNWLTLSRGSNHIRVFAEGDPIPYELFYSTKYGGL